MKQAALFAVTGLFILGWLITGKNLIEQPARYQECMAEAERYEEKGIYEKAIEKYQEALTYDPKDVAIQTQIARDYFSMGELSLFINTCEDVNEKYGYPLESTLLLADHYIEKNIMDKAIQLLEKALDVHPDQEDLSTRYSSVRYSYSKLYVDHEDIHMIRNGCAVIQEGGKEGLIDQDGKRLSDPSYEWAGILDDKGQYFPVLVEGEYFYNNKNGHKALSGDEGQRIEGLGIFVDEVAPAKINGKWGYIDLTFRPLCEYQWDGATVMYNDRAAVKKDGKWALIDERYELLTDYLYDDIAIDGYGYCSINDRIFAKTENGYILLDKNGERVGDDIFDEAIPFASEEPAAVKKGDLWGYVDAEGSMIIEPRFTSARSFSLGLGPVCTTGSSWGYINLTGKLVIDEVFLDARNFYDNGVAPVKQKENSWTMIQLYTIKR